MEQLWEGVSFLKSLVSFGPRYKSPDLDITKVDENTTNMTRYAEITGNLAQALGTITPIVGEMPGIITQRERLPFPIPKDITWSGQLWPTVPFVSACPAMEAAERAEAEGKPTKTRSEPRERLPCPIPKDITWSGQLWPEIPFVSAWSAMEAAERVSAKASTATKTATAIATAKEQQ